MTEHYFTPTPESPSEPMVIHAHVDGRDARFLTDHGVFSWRRLDRGTKLLAESVHPGPHETVLDLGCGYGALGVLAAAHTDAPVFFTDINSRAVGLALANARAQGIVDRSILCCCDAASALPDGTVDLVLLNSPVHAGRAVETRMIRDAGRVLRTGGRLALVARTQQGAKSLGKVMAQWIAPPETVARGSGFRVLVSVKPGA